MSEEKKYTCEYCGKDDFENHLQYNGHRLTCKEKPKGTSQEDRKERIPFGVPVKRFNAPSNDGFVYRVFNDQWRKEPGRIQRASNAGYEIVSSDITGMTVGTNDDGTEIKGVLMRIPKETYEEDQKAKQKELDKVDEQINRGRHTMQANEKRYIPSGSGVQIIKGE